MEYQIDRFFNFEIFFGGGAYVNLGPFILHNIRTSVKPLQKQSS